jgi:hypothetical protein
MLSGQTTKKIHAVVLGWLKRLRVCIGLNGGYIERILKELCKNSDVGYRSRFIGLSVGITIVVISNNI